ncbi:pentapeptide repeat-containing protein [Vacuolonema iberomarrocanum]|uniref:pentapeptide repeat-containing protein n=1 Tax=Vacuolonema iberomarrocanum TaxID=3454632 RepID=UPI001A0817D4|nr:pentapeptide repeat-containing protein [filamentous cyanobacterium LEGE 07170]
MTPDPQSSPSSPAFENPPPNNGRSSTFPNRPTLDDELDAGMQPQRGSVDELQQQNPRLMEESDRPITSSTKATSSQGWILLLAIAIALVGLAINLVWMSLAASFVILVLALRIFWADLQRTVSRLFSEEERVATLALIGVGVAAWTLWEVSNIDQRFYDWYFALDWTVLGATGDLVGAVGQILIAVLAVYIAWRQYVISRDLTIQQNLITQQQTIDAFFQGISELVLDAEGLLEDWPQERAIAEGRTAAILSSVDATGKAKVLRFLSRSRLLTPLKRDRLLGRAMLDGAGGYAEDRDYGVRVVDLGVMLASTNLVRTDLRWTDLSDANMIRVNLRNADLVKTNLARTILVDADLSNADIQGTRFFYGPVATATPRSRTAIPNYVTGEYTGAVVEGANFTNVKRMSEEQRRYCCAWGGSDTRLTIPGGCEDVPNQLGR